MTLLLFIEQFLNGMQFGVFLFLISAGLTLVLGIMNVVNLAHGSLYMIGAYFASTFYGLTGSLIVSETIVRMTETAVLETISTNKVAAASPSALTVEAVTASSGQRPSSCTNAGLFFHNPFRVSC